MSHKNWVVFFEKLLSNEDYGFLRKKKHWINTNSLLSDITEISGTFQTLPKTKYEKKFMYIWPYTGTHPVCILVCSYLFIIVCWYLSRSVCILIISYLFIMVHWYLSVLVSVYLDLFISISIYHGLLITIDVCGVLVQIACYFFFLQSKELCDIMFFFFFLPASHTTLIIAMKIYWTLIPVLFFSTSFYDFRKDMVDFSK